MRKSKPRQPKEASRPAPKTVLENIVDQEKLALLQSFQCYLTKEIARIAARSSQDEISGRHDTVYFPPECSIQIAINANTRTKAQLEIVRALKEQSRGFAHQFLCEPAFANDDNPF